MTYETKESEGGCMNALSEGQIVPIEQASPDISSVGRT